jgi:hypothetical protein
MGGYASECHLQLIFQAVADFRGLPLNTFIRQTGEQFPNPFDFPMNRSWRQE